MPAIGESGFGKVLPEGTGVLLPVDQTDIIPVSFVGGVFSPGDIVIGVGVIIFFVEAARWGKTDSQKRRDYLTVLWKCWSVSKNK